MSSGVDAAAVAGALEAFVSLALGALALRESAFTAVVDEPGGRALALAVVLVAGASTLVGQSVALFLNAVRPFRFVLSTLLASLVFAGTVTVWAVAVWASSALIADHDVPLGDAVAVVMLGHAPHLLSFLLLVPYYGPGLERLVDVWTVLSVGTGLRATTDLGLLEVGVAIGLSFLVVEAARVLLGRWVERVTDWLWRTTAGARTRLRVEGALAALEAQARREARRWVHR